MEATFVLPLFIFMIITIMWVANLCTAQAKIQNAINNTAKEISSISYLYAITEFQDKQNNMAAEGDASAQNINEIIDAVNNTGEELSGANGSNISDTISSVGNNVSVIQSSVEDIASDPKGFLLGMVKELASEMIDSGKNELLSLAAEGLCNKHLATENLSAQEYLSFLGVYDLSYDKSQLFPSDGEGDASKQIMIVATYKLKTIQFFKIDVSFNIMQQAHTYAWGM